MGGITGIRQVGEGVRNKGISGEIDTGIQQEKKRRRDKEKKKKREMKIKYKNTNLQGKYNKTENTNKRESQA